MEPILALIEVEITFFKVLNFEKGIVTKAGKWIPKKPKPFASRKQTFFTYI
jgi:hypothetical protein